MIGESTTQPDYQAVLGRMRRAHLSGDEAATEQQARKLLDLHPDHTEALGLLYGLLRRTGRHEAADATLRHLVAIDPNDIRAATQVAMLLHAAGDLEQAERQARHLIRLAPDFAQSHRLLGTVLTATRRPAAGAYHLRQALRLGGPNAADLEQLGWSLLQLGQLPQARAAYRAAVALAPEKLSALHGQAWVEVADRRPEAALPIITRARALAPPDDVDLRCLHAGALERLHQLDAALAVLHDAEPTPLSLAQKGRLLDRRGRHDEAFAAFTAAKRLARDEKGPYRQTEAEAQAAQLRAFFTSARVKTLPPAGRRPDLPQPIFILGFPRSGTTLLEQTLSISPRISAGDELTCLADVISRLPRLLETDLPYPPALAELWMGDKLTSLDLVRDDYLRRCRAAGAFRRGAVWFTDKMPLNEMHLGLIALLFPASPLIHLVRHPLDVVLSVFSQHMTHGYNCDTAPETIAHHYSLVADLVDHYRSTINLRYLPIRYEDIIQHQEDSVRRIMDFVGEPFEPAMLQFEKNQRMARSASSAAVTEALHARSLYRYRNYISHLQPVIPLLQPVITRLGYQSPD